MRNRTACRKKENASDAENVPLRSRIARPHALFKERARLRLIYWLRISGSCFHRKRKGFCRDRATATFVCTFAYNCAYNFDILV